MIQVVAFSGGKDSTAMALRMADLDEEFVLLFTPTFNELPEVLGHIKAIQARVGKRLVIPPNGSLIDWIRFYNALPSFRMRWCTRQIKIEPCIIYLKQHPGSVLCVGLRADEEARQGLYGDFATYRYPLREWGWGVEKVWSYLRSCGITVPKRTDCAFCFGQRLSEWWMLWREHPDIYAYGEQLEADTGHTFRSPSRDTWPAALCDLRVEFEKGRLPRGAEVDEEEEDAPQACRVCKL